MMKTTKPEWLAEIRDFCGQNGIKIAGWGAESLVVLSESPTLAKQLAAQLEHLGFQTTEDADDVHAGLLTLSRNREALHSGTLEPRHPQRDFSRLPRLASVGPLFFACMSVLGFWPRVRQPSKGFHGDFVFGSIFFLVFVWQGLSVWGWKLQLSQEELRVRRCFVWSAITWSEIRAVVVKKGWGRGNEVVTLTLKPRGSLRLGTFGFPFAHALRDHLKKEFARRRCET